MLLTNASTPRGDRVDVRVEDAVIVAVVRGGTLVPWPREDSFDLAGYVLLPAPAEPHAHLDEAVAAWRPEPGAPDGQDALDHDGYVARGTRAALLGLANGLTAIRTHVAVSGTGGLTALRALTEVRHRVSGAMTVQLVAMAGAPLSGAGGREQRALLREAVAMGADVVGGCPHLDPDPGGCMDVALGVAADHGLPIDLHTDESLAPSARHLRGFAERVLATGFPYGATASHRPGARTPEEIKEVATLVAEAGIHVVAIPRNGLVPHHLRPAGPPAAGALRALMDAGANVAGGSGDLRDPFHSMGRGDPLETAALLAMAARMSPAEGYAAVSERARAAMDLPSVRLEPGHPADLLAVRGDTLTDAVAEGATDRRVFARGRPVASTRTVREMRLPPPAPGGAVRSAGR